MDQIKKNHDNLRKKYFYKRGQTKWFFEIGSVFFCDFEIKWFFFVCFRLFWCIDIKNKFF